MSAAMLCESIWVDRPKYEEAEAHYQRFLAGTVGGSHGTEKKGSSFSPVQEIANARKKIQQTLNTALTSTTASAGGNNRIAQLEEENRELKKGIIVIIIQTLQEEMKVFMAGPPPSPSNFCTHLYFSTVSEELKTALQKLTLRVDQLEKGNKPQGSSQPSKPQMKEESKEDEDDEDFDLFGSDDDEDEEEDEVTKERLAQYAAKKAKKPALIAKSNIILDIKPWDDETDIAAMEKAVRSIECDGLEWQASKIMPVAYGIKKLQISCKVEDEKCGTDFLEEKITEIEDLVQSVDVVAFNKL
ncbi:elongation factor 1-beta-like [Pocillopora damicornis]|uniref:elongation factor 1-beta-like n=1 Tax=Pocillopora damicornis TaxID=46731 RepID=UPI000F5572DD|nr:elongation factor 1-beta-like [Pocillopora damicornis]